MHNWPQRVKFQESLQQNGFLYGVFCVYMFIIHCLAVHIHFAGTQMNLNTNALIRFLGESPNSLCLRGLISQRWKFLMMAVRIRNTVFSAINDLGRRFHPNPLFISSRCLSTVSTISFEHDPQSILERSVVMPCPSMFV